jgi:DNA polymerase family B, exonuclease domain
MIKNVSRDVFFCLKKGENIKDLLAEVKNIIQQKVKFMKDMEEVKIEYVKKKYAFELPVDVDQDKYVDCIKASFSFKRVFKGEEIPYEGKFYKGFFGNSYTPIEHVIIEKMLKGPDWIAVQEYTITPLKDKVSWCNLEITIDDFDDFMRLNIPEKEQNEFPTPKMRCIFLNV